MCRQDGPFVCRNTGKQSQHRQSKPAHAHTHTQEVQPHLHRCTGGPPGAALTGLQKNVACAAVCACSFAVCSFAACLLAAACSLAVVGLIAACLLDAAAVVCLRPDAAAVDAVRKGWLHTEKQMLKKDQQATVAALSPQHSTCSAAVHVPN